MYIYLSLLYIHIHPYIHIYTLICLYVSEHTFLYIHIYEKGRNEDKRDSRSLWPILLLGFIVIIKYSNYYLNHLFFVFIQLLMVLLNITGEESFISY